MATSNAVIDWRCYACNEGGKFANLPDTTLKQIRNAVERGHERRASRCHEKRGIGKIKAVVNGKTLSFQAIDAFVAASPGDSTNG